MRVSSVAGAGVLAAALVASAVVSSPAQAATTTLSAVRVIGGTGHAGLYAWGMDTVPAGFTNAGDVLATDYLNSRIQQFAPDGTLRRTVVLKDGHHQAPYDVAVNPVSGNIAFGDVDGGRLVQIYSMDGTYLRSCKPKMIYPAWLDYDAQGRLAVADSRGQTIGVLDDTTCKVKFTFGTSDDATQGLSTPRGIDFAPDGTLWINDVGHARVAHFAVGATSATYLDSFSSPGGDNRGLLYNPLNNQLYVVKAAANRVEVFSPTGAYVTGFGSEGTAPGQFVDGGRGITLDGTGGVWVGDMPNFRAQKFAADGTPLLSAPAVAQPPPPGGFNGPGAVAVTADGGFVVADTFNWRVQTLNSTGSYSSQFGSRFGLNYARAVTVDRTSGDIVVGNTDFNKIDRYTSSGVFLWERLGIKSYAIEMDQVKGWAYAAGADVNQVWQLDATGRVVRRFGEGLNNPRGVAVDPVDSSVWISSANSGLISHFTFKGVLLGTFPSGAGQAADLAVDADTIYLADPAGNTIRMYDKAGTPTGTFGSGGTAKGRFKAPRGLELVDSSLFVVETTGERIQELRITKS